jgi:hypothetical protein
MGSTIVVNNGIDNIIILIKIVVHVNDSEYMYIYVAIQHYN